MDAHATECEQGSILRTGDRDALISMLNKPLLDEITEERVLRGLCCNLATCRTPQMTEEEIKESKSRATRKKSTGTLQDLSNKLKARRLAEGVSQQENENGEPVVTVEPLFCSERCDKEYAGKVLRRVETINESALHMLGGTPGAPFANLKKAAAILKEFSETQLTDQNVFQKLEKRNIDKLLGQFWKVMAPFEDVKIVEKNTEQLEEATEEGGQ